MSRLLRFLVAPLGTGFAARLAGLAGALTVGIPAAILIAQGAGFAPARYGSEIFHLGLPFREAAIHQEC